jgi:hypothetical protein
MLFFCANDDRYRGSIITYLLFLNRWAGHIARMRARRGVYRALVGKPEGKDHLEDPGVDGRIILRWIFRK